MNVKRVRCIVMAAALVLVAAPAYASGWSPPLKDVRVILPYGVAYGGGTHRGVDLAASAGNEANSPVSGTVTFAGAVPADGGGTCFAATVLTADGLKITLLPLQSTFIAQGEPVNAGEALGLVAEVGDDSSAAPHVHLSVRRGDAYLDPTPFLPLGAAAPATMPVAVDAGAPTDVPSGADTIPAGIAVASASTAAVPSVSVAPAPSGVTAHSTEAASASAPVAETSRQLLEDAEVQPTSALRPDLHFVRGRTPLSLVSSPSGLGAVAAAAMSAIGITAAVRMRCGAEQV